MTVTHLILDVDDVVLDMDESATAAEAGVLDPLLVLFPAPQAEAIHRAFRRGYDVLRRQLRAAPGTVLPEFAELRGRIVRWQRGVIEAGYESKIFSREVLLAIAFEENGVSPEPDTLHRVVDRYWAILAEQTQIYPDARALFARCREKGIRIHLATNSDGFLRLDGEAATFWYDPEHAHRRKLERLAILSELGLGPEDITIGDPVGKPSTAFYQRVLERFAGACGAPIPLGSTMAVGDSMASDVLPLLELGVFKGAWIVRRGPLQASPHPEVQVITRLTELEAAG